MSKKIWIERDEASCHCLVHLNEPVKVILCGAYLSWVDKDGNQAMWSSRTSAFDKFDTIKPGQVAEFELKRIVEPV